MAAGVCVLSVSITSVLGILKQHGPSKALLSCILDPQCVCVCPFVCVCALRSSVCLCAMYSWKAYVGVEGPELHHGRSEDSFLEAFLSL